MSRKGRYHFIQGPLQGCVANQENWVKIRPPSIRMVRFDKTSTRTQAQPLSRQNPRSQDSNFNLINFIFTAGNFWIGKKSSPWIMKAERKGQLQCAGCTSYVQTGQRFERIAIKIRDW